MGPENDEKEAVHQFVARRRREKAEIGVARAMAHHDYGRSIRNDGSLDLPHPSDLARYRTQRSSRPYSISDPGGSPPGAGAATSVAQDLLNGRPVSAAQAAQSALTGDILGGLGGSIGRKWSNSLSSAKKGHLGEALGPLRNEINGEGRGPTTARVPVKSGQTGPLKRKGSYWKPDGLGGPPPMNPGDEWPAMFEDKFGYQASLSKNQEIARENWGLQFHLKHFLPDDIGLMTGVPAATFGAQGFNRARKR